VIVTSTAHREPVIDYGGAGKTPSRLLFSATAPKLLRKRPPKRPKRRRAALFETGEAARDDQLTHQ